MIVNADKLYKIRDDIINTFKEKEQIKDEQTEDEETEDEELDFSWAYRPSNEIYTLVDKNMTFIKEIKE